jgi:SRSO17 transposase
MSLLQKPEAMALLEDAELSGQSVAGCGDRLVAFLERFLPHFYRKEQREAATVIIQGKLSNLQRKTCEPIAIEAGLERKPLQKLVGAGKWDDDAVRGELWRHVGAELGDPEAVLIIDPSGFPKKGTESCGVGRQWCGCLGKVENCQVGVFVSYASCHGHTLVDGRLYLPEDWATDNERRDKCHVPKTVIFQEKWRIGLDLLDRVRGQLPHRWVVGDDELGRVTELRAQLRKWDESYVLDVPCNTLVREVEAGPERGPFERFEVWAARQPKQRWKTWTIRDGEKEPIRVEVLKRRLQTKDEAGRVGPTETGLVIRTLGDDAQTSYALSNAAREVPPVELIRPKLERHRIEEDLKAGKQEVGLSHYEVRSWTGWHHHVTLSLLALWFVVSESLRLKKKRQR